MAVNRSHLLVPWADALYACDGAFWVRYAESLAFPGLKVSQTTKNLPGVEKVRLQASTRRMLFDQFGEIGAGGNSGFQALNLAIQWGATRILLIGFDMHDNSGIHWYGRNNWQSGNNPSESNFRRWRAAFQAAVPVLEGLGVEVINASPLSDLKAFPRRSVTDTLKEWGLS